MFSAAHSSPSSRERVWQFLKEKWDEFKQKFQGQFLLARMIGVSGWVGSNWGVGGALIWRVGGGEVWVSSCWDEGVV